MTIMYGEKSPIQNRSAKYQYIAALVVFIILINYGIFTGWTSPNIELLTSDDSPLSTGPITMDEASWITSLLALGAVVGNLAYGIIMSRFGRKWPMVFLSIPTILSWFLIALAKNVYYLYAARILQGVVAGGVLMTIPVYIVEIANDSVRGTLSSFVGTGSAVGILLAYTLGNYCSYSVTPIVAIISTLVFAILLAFFPETPLFLVRQNKIVDAEMSLRFYQSIPPNNEKYILSEIERLKSAVGALESKKCVDRRLKCSDFTTKPGSRAMIIATCVTLLNQFAGVSVMLAYTATFFDASGSAMSPNTSAMVVGSIKVLGTFVVTPLIDRAGRRFLYIVSALGTATAQIVLGIFMMLNTKGYDVEAYNWIIIVSFSFALFVSAFAVQTLPIVVSAEVMPEKLKDIGITYAVAVFSLSAFITLKFIPLLADLIGLHGCIFLFATVCLSGAAFAITYLPETKNKSYEEIMNSLR